MSDLILKLALQGVDDDAAAEVLLDAIEETGWKDARIYGLAYEVGRPPYRRRLHIPLLSEIPPWAVKPRDRACAIAAVLLFGDWPTTWPLADRCIIHTPAERFEAINRLLSMNYITREQAIDLLDMPADEFWSTPIQIRAVQAQTDSRDSRQAVKESEVQK